MSNATKWKNRLKELAGKAGELAFERVGLAAKLLADVHWLAEEFPVGTKEEDGKRVRTGGEEAARDYLEQDFFGDLCGALTLGQLLKIYQRFPTLAEWKRHNFHLARLWAAALEVEAAEKPEPPKSERRKATVAMLEEAEESIQHWRAVAERQEREAVKASSSLAEIRRKLEEKEREIARLQGRIEELERMLGRQLVAA